MSLTPPPDGWFRAPSGHERTWIGLAIAWCVVLTIMMPLWHFKGKQNATGETYRVSAVDYLNRVQRQVDEAKVGEYQGRPIVEATPGGDVYLLAQMWQWYPVLKLREGQTYRLHVSSLDLQHGFSLVPVNMNFQVLPGYDHVLTISPTRAGDYTIICNEYCGIGHHQMTGRIIVDPAATPTAQLDRRP